MYIIRHIVALNRTASAWLAKSFPRIFSDPKPSYRATLLERVNCDIRDMKPKTILEAGGVDRPVLNLSPNFEFVGLDIEERPNCANLYDSFIVQSIEHPLPVKADIIISFTLLEHVPNNTAAIESIFGALTEGGKTHHYVPSGMHPYSLALRAIGPRLQRFLIPILRPGTENVTGYPAFFNLCTPKAMNDAFRSVGFTDIDIQAFYRANDYFAFFTPAFIIVTFFENACAFFNIRSFASGFVISARKGK